MTETDFYREIFYLARRNLAVANKLIEKLSNYGFDFNLMEKYFSSRDRNELTLVREIISKINPQTITKELLVKKACNLNKPTRAKNFYSATAVELFLADLSLEEIFKIIPHISGSDYLDKVMQEVKSREKDVSSFNYLILYQTHGNRSVREISREAILTIPREFLSYDTLLSDKLKNPLYQIREISFELLIIHYESKLSNDLLMKALLFSSERIFNMVKSVLNKRFSEGKISKDFVEKYLNKSKNNEQFEIAVDLSIRRDLDDDEKAELENFCSEFIF